jgi:hypothetical protein
VKNLFNENSKISKKEVKKDIRKKDVSCAWIGKINVVKMTLLKAIDRFNEIPTQIQCHSSQK